MKSRHSISKLFAAVFLTIGASSLPAAPAVPAAQPASSKSVFIYPQTPNEGRDPFFPDSTRPYEDAPNKVVNAASLTDLYVKSILQSDGRVFAIINNHTFAPGEEGMVITKDGHRMNIKCLAIDSKGGIVTVESGGAKAALHFSSSP